MAGNSPSDPAVTTAACVPDLDQIGRFLDVAFGYCNGLIAVRGIAEKGQGANSRPRNIWVPSDAMAPARIEEYARSAVKAGLAVFVVPGTVAKVGQASAAHVHQMQTILVDLDHGDIGAKRDYLADNIGEPSLEIASGGVTADGQRKRHLYWRLSEPAQGDDIETLCSARHLLAVKAGGDPAFGSAHQPIRVAGTIHNKSGTPRIVEILQQRTRDFDLAELIEAITAMPPLEGLAIVERDHCGPRGRGKAATLFVGKVREDGVDGTTRFEALTRIIGYWVRRCREGHVTADTAWDEIVDFNLAQVVPPWPQDRLRREADKIWQIDHKRHGDFPPSTNVFVGKPGAGTEQHSILPWALSEDSLAEEFSRVHGDDWRYVAAWGQWLNWTGKVWRRESTLLAYDLARRICRVSAAHADPKLGARISTASTIAAVERIARADRRHAEGTEAWDREPWLLNTPKGLLDLRTGQVSPHDRTLAMSKITSASPEGACPVWREFLGTVTGGDIELQFYLQRMAGYCLTGVTTEHALFFLYGTGANGNTKACGI